MIYVGFLRRCFAFTADFLIIMLIYTALKVFLLGCVMNEGCVFFDSHFFIFLFWGLFLYFTILEASPFKATLGKLLVGIKVYGMNGSKLTFYKSAIRSLIKTVLLFPVCCAFIFGILMFSVAVAALVVKYPAKIDVIHSIMFFTVTQSSFFTLKSFYALTPFIAFAYLCFIDTKHKQYIHDFPVKSVVAEYKKNYMGIGGPFRLRKGISYYKIFIATAVTLLCLIVAAVKFNFDCNMIVSTCIHDYYKDVALWDKQYLSDINLTITAPFEFSSGRRNIQRFENENKISYLWPDVRIDYFKKSNDEYINANIENLIEGGVDIIKLKIKISELEGKKITYKKKRGDDTIGYGAIILLNKKTGESYLISLFSKISQSVNEKVWRSIEIK
ncbi:MAG: RDD family protein [Endomicrobia bacterium]|nr:RDD family protein [Endomicrobiia bacterium]